MIKIGLKIALLALVGHWLVAGLARGDEFTEALNVQRFQRGLSPVASSPGLQSTAARNNAAQAYYGRLGHFVPSGFGECAGYGYADTGSALFGWLTSGPHAAILLDPRIIAVGYHQLGVAHTVSVSWTPIAEQRIVTSSPQAKPAASQSPHGSAERNAIAPTRSAAACPCTSPECTCPNQARATVIARAHTAGGLALACPTASPVAMPATTVTRACRGGSCRGGWHPFRRRRVVMFQ